jgi:hypothetical protein
LSIACAICGESARLKLISDYPFTRGLTEATYACSHCGDEMKRVVARPDQHRGTGEGFASAPSSPQPIPDFADSRPKPARPGSAVA